MNLLILLNLAIPFLILEVDGNEGEKVRVNVPKTLVGESLLFAEVCDDSWKKDIEKIPRDSILKILQEAEVGNEPILEIEDGSEIIRFWIKDSKDIIQKGGPPKTLIVNVRSDNEEENVNLRLPLTVVKLLPFFIPEIGEDAGEVKQTKIFLRKALEHLREVEGSFTFVEIEDKNEKVKISIE